MEGGYEQSGTQTTTAAAELPTWLALNVCVCVCVCVYSDSAGGVEPLSLWAMWEGSSERSDSVLLFLVRGLFGN